jgi:hypothetical protein
VNIPRETLERWMEWLQDISNSDDPGGSKHVDLCVEVDLALAEARKEEP